MAIPSPRPPAPPPDEARLAQLVAFSQVPGIGPARLARLQDRFGDLAEAWRAPEAALEPFLDPRSRAALIELRARSRPEALLTALSEAGILALGREDPRFPGALARLPQPPYLLYVRGGIEHLARRAVAVVGTRKPTSYGKHAAARLAGDLAAAGVAVVSGLALGIDGVAHAAALDAGGVTLAVLGSGVDVIYPRGHQRLAERILASGALISEFPPGRPPDPGNFPARNRIISGLASAVVVVEAGAKSGALITADFALEQGGDVFAVPGSIFSPMSVGPHRLLAAGAAPVTDAADILESLDLARAVARDAARRELPAEGAEAGLLAQLAAEPVHVDEIGRQAGLPSAAVSATLACLELKGLVEHVGGMRWVLRP